MYRYQVMEYLIVMLLMLLKKKQIEQEKELMQIIDCLLNFLVFFKKNLKYF